MTPRNADFLESKSPRDGTEFTGVSRQPG
jgi:hypothetical protein